jgi:hypothetical protein
MLAVPKAQRILPHITQSKVLTLITSYVDFEAMVVSPLVIHVAR